jgi:type I restriction enzyme S subunit
MFFEKVGINNLETRLDAGFYEPKYLKLIERLKNIGAVKLKHIVSKIACGPFGGNAIADDIYQDQGLFFIRPVNISSNIFDDNSLVKVPENVLKENGLKIYEGDNLYFGRVGVPCVALITGKTSISPNIIIAETKSISADPYYLACFSSSIFGLSQLKRQLKEVAQPTTSTDAVKDLLVFEPNIAVQTYIGNKARQAQLLKEWSKKTDIEIGNIHQRYIPEQSKLNFTKKTRLVSQRIMTERMDAHFYPSVVDTYLKDNPVGFVKFNDCCIDLFNGQSQPETTIESCEQITVTNLSSSFIKGNTRLVEKPKNSGKFLNKNDLLICNAAHQKYYIGRDITFNHSSHKLLPSTEVMIIRADTSKVPASYIRTYLQTKLGFTQIQSTIRGITAHSYPVDMAKLDIFLPKMSETEKTEWFKTDERLVIAGEASELATKLTKLSRFLVESLIEGQITETQLIEAQQAIEDCDNSKDRAILSKITDKGYKANGGKPLFDDLDKLYQLLDEANVYIGDASSENEEVFV